MRADYVRPGCGRSMRKDDPWLTLASITAHEFLCAPPGVTDMLLAAQGHYTRPFALWAGRSVETMVRSLAST